MMIWEINILNYEYKIPKKIDDGWKTLSLTEEGIDLNKIENSAALSISPFHQ